MKKYTNILFDLDGTLTDPKVGITKSVAYALKSFGIEVKDLDSLCKFIGPPLRVSFRDYYGFSEEECNRAVEKYREYFSETGMFENRVYPGIEELLKSLKKNGRKLFVATSKPTVFAVKILEHFDLLRYFDDVSGSELDGSRDRKGDVIRFALQKNGLTGLTNVVMVGDREHDVVGAKENNIDVIGVLYGYGDRAELEKAGADYIVENVENLHSLLCRSGGS
ncbi:5'-nucleotidase [Thermoclostridium stercorarium subsp. stercorarium DSM 8532]|uniref:5'-nucleotidase n=2 Tax=Thermoclostridium stercorarium TaxID=1510 RepID=L7VTH7_THES1|nr:HAD family hydrolase [Thermoclostridium stercorarium]AGC68883.1 5'-nucleotidase [Thermoclostridium stercorarium subsp. stercorarium DSM 8532]AGI39878.1 phosphatase [Thermoclostridium stercorarium subsp. stercorarium DSM 8532]ANX01743.1 phosphoglycolate phosphatase [Thermoclostridium stercorarium subsp. leptospartum DSM 9219]